MLKELPQNKAVVCYSRDPLGHWKGLEVQLVDVEQKTIQQTLIDTGIWEDFQKYPLYCSYNGNPILRARYEELVLNENDILIIHNQPYGGGGGSDPLRVVLQVALIAATLWAGPLAGAALAGTGASATSLALWTAVASAVIMVGGSLLIDLIAPLPTPDDNLTPRDPAYKLAPQGNQARLGQPIPIRYGKTRIYPDFAAIPYSEYTSEALNRPSSELAVNPLTDGLQLDNFNFNLLGTTSSYTTANASGETRQILNLLYCVGQGEFNITDIRLGDTPIDNFEDVVYEIYPPGTPVTLFPTNVDVSTNVNGQELTQNNQTGPFPIGDIGETINAITIDLAFPTGLVRVKSNGHKEKYTVSFNISIQEINDAGTPTGVSNTITRSVEAKTLQPLYKTFRITGADLPSGTFNRYQVGITRTTEDAKERFYTTSIWVGLRGYVPSEDPDKYAGLTMAAVRLVAGEEVSSIAQRQFNFICETKLKQYVGAGLFNGTATATRNVGQAIIHMARESFGLNLNDAQIDLDGIKALGDAAATDGIQFDYSYTSEISSWDAVRLAAATINAEPIIQNGILRIVQDAQRVTSVAAFTPDNIIPGTLATEYIIPNSYTADHLVVEYFDEAVNYEYKTVPCVVPGQPSNNPVNVRLDGIVNRDKAYQWGMFKARSNFLRRRFLTWNASTEGFLPTKFDVVDITSPEIDEFMYAGVVYDLETTSFTNDTLVLTTNEIQLPAPDTYYISFRDMSTGAMGAAYQVIRVDDQRVRFASDPGGTVIADIETYLATGSDQQATYFAMGKGTYWRRRVKILAVRPVSNVEVQLNGVVEDDQVFNDSGDPITPSIPPYLLNSNKTAPDAPVVTYRVIGNTTQQVVELTWAHVQYAQYYVISMSRDSGVTWQREATNADTNWSFPFTSDELPLRFRVAGVGTTRGDWSNVVIISTNVVPEAFNVDETSIVYSETEATMRIQWDAPTPNLGYRVKVYWPDTTSSPSNLKRTIDIPYGQRSYAYSYRDAIEDDPDTSTGINLIKNGARDCVFEVYGRIDGNPGDPDDYISDTPARFIVNDPLNPPDNNPQFPALSNPAIEVVSAAVWISYDVPDDILYAGIEVHASTTQGFTPNASTRIKRFTSRSGNHNIGGWLDQETEYYVRFGGHDYWGYDDIAWTPEYHIITAGPQQSTGYFNPTAPPQGTPWTLYKGDVWFDTDGGTPWPQYRYDGAFWNLISYDPWIEILYNARNATATVDGRVHLFLQDTEPQVTELRNYGEGDTFGIGDIWVDTNFGNAPYQWDGDSWEPNGSINSTSYAVYIQPNPPTGGVYKEGDMWYDSDNGNKQYVYHDGGWEEVGVGGGSNLTPVFLIFTGQSNAVGQGAATVGSMPQNANVYDWTTGGSGTVYDWESPDPEATQRADFPDPVPDVYTGMRLGGYGNIGWAAADAINRATGRPVYMVTVHRGASGISFWETGGTVKAEIDTQVAAALASPELANAGITKADAVIWMQGESDSASNDIAYLTSLQGVIDDWATQGFVEKEYTQFFFCELSWANTTLFNRNGAFHAYDNASTEYYRVISSRGRATIDNTHYTGDELNNMGASGGKAFVSGTTPKTVDRLAGTRVFAPDLAIRETAVAATGGAVLTLSSDSESHLRLTSDDIATRWDINVEGDDLVLNQNAGTTGSVVVDGVRYLNQDLETNYFNVTASNLGGQNTLFLAGNADNSNVVVWSQDSDSTIWSFTFNSTGALSIPHTLTINNPDAALESYSLAVADFGGDNTLFLSPGANSSNVLLQTKTAAGATNTFTFNSTGVLSVPSSIVYNNVDASGETYTIQAADFATQNSLYISPNTNNSNVLLQTRDGVGTVHTFTFNSTGVLALPDVTPGDANAVRKDYVDLVATYTEGDGINIVSNEISVELYAGDSYLIHDATTGAVRLNTLGIVTTDQAQTISGAKTFSATLTANAGISVTGILATLNSGTTAAAPTDASHWTRKDYVDGIAIYTGGNGIDVTGQSISVDLDVSPGLTLSASGLKVDRFDILDLTTNQSNISGKKTFSTVPASTVDPVAGDDLVRKSYADANYDNSYTAGNSIDITTGTISVDIHPDAYLAHDTGQLNINALKTATIDTTQSFSGQKTFNAASTYTKDIIPVGDSLYDLGSATVGWATIYGDVIYEGGVALSSKYATAYMGGDGIDITGSTISVDLNANAYLAMSGGTLTINALKTATIDTAQSFSGQKTFNAATTYAKDVIPVADSLYDLGSATVRWAQIHADTIYEGASTLATTYVPQTRTITAGNGLTGGGNLTANRTLSIDLDTSPGLVVSASGLKVDRFDILDLTTAQSNISGKKTFSTVPASTANPSAADDLVRKGYADSTYASAYTGGNSIDITGSTISVDISADAYLAHDAGKLNINALKTMTVDTTQSISGQKTFTSTNTYAKTILPSAHQTYNLGSGTAQWGTIFGYNFVGYNLTTFYGTLDCQGTSTMRTTRPSTNNTYDCGSSTYRWANVYTVALNTTGASTLNGALTGWAGFSSRTTTNPASYFHWTFYQNTSSYMGGISTNGFGTIYNTSSDYRLKQDWVPLENATDRVMALKPYSGSWVNRPDIVSDYFIAHEAAEVLPYAITGEKDGEQMQGMDYSMAVPLLTAALQEEIRKNKSLENRVSELEGRLSALESRLSAS